MDLRGECVSFTGWLSRKRDDYIKLIRRHGGSHLRHVSNAVTVMVKGTPNASYKWVTMGTKLDGVAYRQALGQRIFVISEAELDRLLAGSPLTSSESRAARSTALSPLGVVYRPAQIGRQPSGREQHRSITIDLDQLERRSASHRRLTNEVARYLSTAGRQPLSPAWSDCLFDVGWEAGATFHVVEVKTTIPGAEVQQMRLGLGQVLDYRHTLLGLYSRVNAHLVLSSEPDSPHMVDVSEAHGVRVSWPPEFEGLLGR